MPYAIRRVDRNQPDVFAYMRAHGALVHPTHTLGKGFPDCCVNWRGRIYLFEIKDPEQAPSRRVLTPDEQAFMSNWNECGQTVFVVHSGEEAMQILRANS